MFPSVKRSLMSSWLVSLVVRVPVLVGHRQQHLPGQQLPPTVVAIPLTHAVSASPAHLSAALPPPAGLCPGQDLQLRPRLCPGFRPADPGQTDARRHRQPYRCHPQHHVYNSSCASSCRARAAGAAAPASAGSEAHMPVSFSTGCLSGCLKGGVAGCCQWFEDDAMRSLPTSMFTSCQPPHSCLSRKQAMLVAA